MSNAHETPRHKKLRVRAFEMGVQIKDLAKRIGYHREYVSQLLRGADHSTPGLDKIERTLDEIAREGNHAAAA